jgi:hypothetical protein
MLLLLIAQWTPKIAYVHDAKAFCPEHENRIPRQDFSGISTGTG